MPQGRPLALGEVHRDPVLADALELLGAEGPAPFYAGEVGAAIVDWVRERGGTLTREDLAAYAADPARAGARRLPRARGPDQPAAERGRHAAGLRARAARARRRRRAGRRRAGARDGGRAVRAHPGVPRRARRARLPGALHGQPARLDDAHLGARRRGLGVRGHVHQRRGLRARGARHRRARQQHDGRAGPLAAGLLHASAGAPAAVDDGADGRARAAAGRSSCSAPPAPTGSARRCCR